MSKSCFQQAAETLTDALLVMPDAHSVSSPQKAYIATVALEKANTRLFSPEAADSDSDSGTGNMVHVPIDIIQHDGAVQGWSTGFRHTTGNKYFVIRMEVNNYEINHDEGHAILLHNFASLWLLEANISSNETRMSTQDRAETSCQLLQLALSILATLYATCRCPLSIQRIISVMAIVGDSLSQAMTSLGRVADAYALKKTLLDKLDLAVRELAHAGHSLDYTKASPAA
jgi:hypothetical protein